MLKKILFTVPILIIAAVGGVYFWINQQAETQADLFIEQALASGAYQELSYSSVKINLFNQELTLNDLRIVDLQQSEYILHEVVVSDYDYQHDIPYHLNIAATGISFPRGLPEAEVPLNPAVQGYLDSLLEADSIPLMVNYHYEFEPENNNLIASEMSIGLENAANLSFSGSIQNIPLETLFNDGAASSSNEAMQTQLMTSVLSAEIPYVGVEIQDLGIIDAIMDIQAQQAGLPIDTLRQQLITTIQNLYFFAPPATQQIAMDISNELASFLEGDKILKISIEPEFNGNIQQLQPQVIGAVFGGDYNAILELLNLQVSTQ